MDVLHEEEAVEGALSACVSCDLSVLAAAVVDTNGSLLSDIGMK